MKVRLCWGQLLKRLSVCVAGLFSVQRSGECGRTFAFEPLEPRLALAAGLVDIGAQPSGSLTGKVVFAAAGHGWQWNTTLNRWATDRGNLLSIVEDFGNQDQLTYYVDYLHRSGATVVPMRPVGRQLNEAVLDNDSPDVTFSGAWSNNTAGPRWYDEDYGASVDPVKYRFASVNSQAETATATYAPNLPATGFYPVYTWVSHSTNRTNQLYKVNHSGGTTEVRVDHRNVGNGWVYLGTYHFDAGRSPEHGSVLISNQSSSGGSVVIADAIRFGNGMGDVPWNNSGIGNGNVSGYPREDEGSILWAWRGVGQGTGFSTPRSIVGTSNVSAPLRFAAEMHAPAAPYGTSVYVSFHSNATTGNPATATARGAIGLISSSSPTPNQADLALFMGRQLNVDMRALNGNFEHDWSTRTGNTLTGGFGEISNNWADNKFDATIIEVGFHDNTLDAELLRDSKVRRQLGRSTYEATLEHLFTNFGTTSRPANVTVPSSPVDVRVTSTEAGTVSLRWNPGLQSTGGFSGVHGSPATGYRIYASTNGYGFDGGAYVSGGGTTSVSLAGYDPDVAYFFKIVAENAGGQSQPSEVLAVTPNGGDRQVLVVNGFDRIDRSQNFKQPYAFGGTTTDRVWERYGNSRDYSVPLQQAIQAARPGVRVDSTSNEAVINGTVDLSQYDAVIWLLGTESVADQTFSPTEQALVNQFVSGGGHLLVTGSEVAYDLDLQNNGRTFFRSTLGASYAADSSGSYIATPIVGGIFAGLNSFSFSSGDAFSSLVGQTYNVRFADVMNPQTGSAPALRYGVSGGIAAIQKPGTQGRGNVVTFGFPIETIVNEQNRAQVIDRVLEFFDVDPVVAVPPKVIDVIIASGSWSAAMIDAVDGQGTGAGNGLGLSLVGADQLVNLSWTGIDRIYIKFDQDVESTFVPSNLTLRGTNVADYLTDAQLTYGQEGTNVGAIMLASPLGHDALLLTLFDSITSAGLALDGEWVDGASLVSGNGMAGGAFYFRIDSLPGDVNDNGGVNTADVLAVNAQRGLLTTDLVIARFDINSNGGINTADVLAVNALRGTILPAAPQRLPAPTQPLVVPTPLSKSGLLNVETTVSATQFFAAPSVVSPLRAGDLLEEASPRFGERATKRGRPEYTTMRKPTVSSLVAFSAADAKVTIPTQDAKSGSLLEGESSDAKLEVLAKASASQRSSLRRFRR